MSFTAVAAATTILANAMKALDSLREQAKGSKDTSLKENISKLFDSMLDLKAAVMRVEEENSELRQKIAQRDAAPEKTEPELRQVGDVNYYFVGAKGPFCQPCYDVDPAKGRLVALMPRQKYAGGTGRKCEVCGKVFFEEPSLGGTQVRVFRA
jgi:hypothetical protein